MKTIRSNSLTRTLRANAAFTAISAILMISLNSVLMPLFNLSNAWILPVVGGGLILYALDLFIASRKNEVPFGKVYFFVIGDLAWVVGSIILLAVAYQDLNGTGIILIDLVAIIVGIFGILQYRLVSRAKSSKTVADIS